MKQEASKNQPPRIFRHSKRPQWGLAIPKWVRGDKHAFHFEDGKVRVFKHRFLDLMQIVDTPPDETASTLKRLGHAARKQVVATKVKTKDRLPISAQFLLLNDLFPKGFRGDAWQRKKRGLKAKRRLKRHRDGAIAEAKEFFQALSTRLQADEIDEIHTDYMKMMGGTDLVSASDMRNLESVYGETARRLYQSLADLLATEERFSIRFERWLTSLSHAMGKAPTWRMATAPLALAKPHEYVCVKKSAFERQARWMAPNLRIAKRVSAQTYDRLNEMAHSVSERLVDQGYYPVDLLDTYDFIVETLTPKKMERAKELLSERKEHERAQTALERGESATDSDSSEKEITPEVAQELSA